MWCTGTHPHREGTRQVLHVIELCVVVHRVHLWCTGHPPPQLYTSSDVMSSSRASSILFVIVSEVRLDLETTQEVKQWALSSLQSACSPDPALARAAPSFKILALGLLVFS